MELLLNILFIILIGFTSACFTKLIVYSFSKGNIFDWYYDIILSKIQNPKLFKVLGGCYVCFNVWISTFIFELFHYVLGLHYVLFIPFIASSFIMSYAIVTKESAKYQTTNDNKTTIYKKKTYISFIKTKKK